MQITEAGKAPEPVLAVEDLQVVFHSGHAAIHAVNGVSLTLRRGELLGIVGESGCGKSVSMLALMQLLPKSAEIVSGAASFEGRDLLRMDRHELGRVRGGRIGYVFQDPMTSLNPVLTIGRQLVEPLRRHLRLGRREARERAIELLRLVGLPAPEKRLMDFPHQLSGGMRQRAMIAIALSCQPAVLIADEPTTALDVTIQAQILDLVRRLRREIGMSIIWITHDLGVIAGLADRVMIMYAGQVVESGPVRQIFSNASHPYTRALLQTLPDPALQRGGRLRAIAGQPPLLSAPPRSCPFAPRCPEVHDRCLSAVPALLSAGNDHLAACWQVAAAEAEPVHA